MRSNSLSPQRSNTLRIIYNGPSSAYAISGSTVRDLATGDVDILVSIVADFGDGTVRAF